MLYEQKPFSLINGTYMDLQIDQIVVLHTLTQKLVFDEYAKKWHTYAINKRNFLKIVIQKIRSLIIQ